MAIVNQARTLLINRPSTEIDIESLGGIYVDPSFKPVNEVDAVIRVKRVLFGTDPDSLTYNFRAAEYMNLLRGDVAAIDYIKSLDPRLTDEYRHWPDFSITPTFIHTVSGNLDFALVDKYRGDDFKGQNTASVKLVFNSSDLNTCLVHNYTTNTDTSIDYDVASITQFDIPEMNDLKAQIFNLSDITGSPEVLVEAKAYPSRTLLEIAKAVIASGAHNFDYQLPNDQPYNSFLGMAKYSVSAINRLIGILLLVIASNEQQRLKQ